MPAQVIFGDVRELDADELKATLQKVGIKRIDTAARYMNGESEKKIGGAKLPETFTIDTKILFTPPGDGTLAPDAIEKSLSNSLKVLGVDKVNVLYCHAPDFSTPIAEQAKAFNEQYKKGRFVHLGVSNFSASMLEEWLTIAEKENYIKPSVYEGQYNLLCRASETTLFPLLRKHNIHFNAYSPLAGGFLLGNFTADGHQGGKRFAQGGQFTQWYDKPSMHEAITRLRSVAERTGIGMDELSLRWIVHHSVLGDEDCVILGASRTSQIEKNTAQVKKGPLDEAVARELSDLWGGVKDDGMAITASVESRQS